MVISIVDIMGITANILSNVAYLPQIIRSYRRKRVDDLSIGMFLTLFITNICWIGYALPIKAMHLWTSALIEIALLLPIFGFWFRYKTSSNAGFFNHPWGTLKRYFS
jgi:MtN3 and saliva related transmembrane protein